MLASEMIKRLQKMIKIHGDIDVHMQNQDGESTEYGNESVRTITKIDADDPNNENSGNYFLLDTF